MPTQAQIESLLESLLEQKAALIRSIEDKTQQINNLYADENPGDESDRIEARSVDFKETTIITSQQDRLLQINDAIERINNKTYGICEMCDETIPIARLKAKPFAKYCINCRQHYENQNTQQGSQNEY